MHTKTHGLLWNHIFQLKKSNQARKHSPVLGGRKFAHHLTWWDGCSSVQEVVIIVQCSMLSEDWFSKAMEYRMAVFYMYVETILTPVTTLYPVSFLSFRILSKFCHLTLFNVETCAISGSSPNSLYFLEVEVKKRGEYFDGLRFYEHHIPYHIIPLAVNQLSMRI